jgi:hypothetical protein
MRRRADILIIYEAFLCSLTERDDSGKDSATFGADIAVAVGTDAAERVKERGSGMSTRCTLVSRLLWSSNE